MREILGVIAAMFLLLSSLCYANVLVNEDFENYEVGEIPIEPWAAFTRNAADAQMFTVDDRQAFGGTKSLYVDVTSTWASFGALFESDAAFITYELHGYYPEDSAELRAIFMITAALGIESDNDSVKATYLAFRKGFVSYHDGAWHDNVPCESKEWYHVACEIDLNAQKFDIYVNDMKSPVEQGAGFWHPANKLSYALVRSYEGSTPCWIDNVFVYEGKLGTESSAVDAAGKKATVWGTIKDQY